MPNFDNTEKEPWVLPGKVPALLINGASGIAVGVATSIPPHNLNEVCDAIVYKLRNKNASPEDIMNIIKGPDFPTGGIALMSQASANGYLHGRGQMRIRGKADIDEKGEKITIKEIPYNGFLFKTIQCFFSYFPQPDFSISHRSWGITVN